MNGRILIVDDIASNRILYRARLAAAFYDPLLATSGAECLAMAAALQPDLILLDLQLPDLPGQEVLRRLREIIGIRKQLRATFCGRRPVLIFRQVRHWRMVSLNPLPLSSGRRPLQWWRARAATVAGCSLTWRTRWAGRSWSCRDRRRWLERRLPGLGLPPCRTCSSCRMMATARPEPCAFCRN